MTPAQCRMARAALRWTVHSLAAAAQVAPNTVVRFEKDGGIQVRSMTAMERALREAGAEFLPGGAVRLRDDPG